MDAFLDSAGMCRLRRMMPLLAAGILFAHLAYLGMWFRKPIGYGGDFDIRYGEVLCLRQGIDPYRVWSRQIDSPSFVRYDDVALQTFGGARHRVNGYTPWEYTLFLPLSFLPEQPAYWLVQMLSLGAFAWMLALLFRKLGAISDDARRWIHSGFGFLLLYDNALMAGLHYGNYGALMACALGGLVWALQRKRDFAAGCCLAFLATKPQIGALVAVPIFFSPRWRSCVVAGALCLAGSVWPWIACGTDSITMIREVMTSGQYYLLHGIFIYDYALSPLLARHCGPLVANGFSLVVLVTVVFLSFRMLNKSENWFVRLAPAVTFVPLWTYSLQSDRVILWLPLFVLLSIFLSKQFTNKLRGWALASVLILTVSTLFRTFFRISSYLSILPLRPEQSKTLCGSFELVVPIFLVMAVTVIWLAQLETERSRVAPGQ